MNAHLPRIWLVLIGLTAAALVIGHVEGAAHLKGWEAAILLALAAMKARLVLRHFLELSPGTAWFSAFFGSIIALVVVILGLFLIPRP